jgi:hypothetical protein
MELEGPFVIWLHCGRMTATLPLFKLRKDRSSLGNDRQSVRANHLCGVPTPWPKWFWGAPKLCLAPKWPLANEVCQEQNASGALLWLSQRMILVV